MDTLLALVEEEAPSTAEAFVGIECKQCHSLSSMFMSLFLFVEDRN